MKLHSIKFGGGGVSHPMKPGPRQRQDLVERNKSGLPQQTCCGIALVPPLLGVGCGRIPQKIKSKTQSFKVSL